MKRYSRPARALASLFGIYDAKRDARRKARFAADWDKVELIDKALSYLEWRIDNNLKGAFA